MFPILQKSAGALDPVCGMTVDPQHVAGSSIYQGKTYYFCSKGCVAKFEANPEKYLHPAVKPEQVDMAIVLNDGRRLTKHVEKAIGSLDVPMSDEGLEAKFADLAEGTSKVAMDKVMGGIAEALIATGVGLFVARWAVDSASDSSAWKRSRSASSAFNCVSTPPRYRT